MKFCALKELEQILRKKPKTTTHIFTLFLMEGSTLDGVATELTFCTTYT